MVELSGPGKRSRVCTIHRGLASTSPSVDHWRHFGAMAAYGRPGRNAVRRQQGGIDSDYELNFGRAARARYAGGCCASFPGESPPGIHRSLATGIWRGKSPFPPDCRIGSWRPLTPQKYCSSLCRTSIAALAGARAIGYLEVGTGQATSRLSSSLRPGALVLMISRMLPFSFLKLHRTFPSETFMAANEAPDVAEAIAAERLLFLYQRTG